MTRLSDLEAAQRYMLARFAYRWGIAQEQYEAPRPVSPADLLAWYGTPAAEQEGDSTMTGSDLPLSAAAKAYVQAALSAQQDADTTWITDAAGKRIAAIVPCDVAMRGDWRKIARPRDGDGHDADRTMGSREILPVPPPSFDELAGGTPEAREFTDAEMGLQEAPDVQVPVDPQELAAVPAWMHGMPASRGLAQWQAERYGRWLTGQPHDRGSSDCPNSPAGCHRCREPRRLASVRYDRRCDAVILDQHGQAFEDGDLVTIPPGSPSFDYLSCLPPGTYRMTWSPVQAGWRLDEVGGA